MSSEEERRYVQVCAVRPDFFKEFMSWLKTFARFHNLAVLATVNGQCSKIDSASTKKHRDNEGTNRYSFIIGDCQSQRIEFGPPPKPSFESSPGLEEGLSALQVSLAQSRVGHKDGARARRH